MPKATGFSHLVLTVPEIDRLVPFFVDFLGLECRYIEGKRDTSTVHLKGLTAPTEAKARNVIIQRAVLGCGNFSVELEAPGASETSPHAKGLSFERLAFECDTNNIQELAEWIKAKGLKTEKIDAEADRVVFVGPAGMRIELILPEK